MVKSSNPREDPAYSDDPLAREKLVAEARQLLADAGDDVLDEQATARFSEIERDLEAMAERPEVIDSSQIFDRLPHLFPAGQAPGYNPHTQFGAAGDPHPLAYTPAAMLALQAAIDERAPLRVRAADPNVQFATLTTGTHGAPRAWGSNVLRGPRMLHMVAGVPRQGVEAIYAQFPQLSLPTAQPVTAEAASLVEYASSATGSVTLGRFGRWTDLSGEALIGTDAASITQMHRLGVALDLDNVLIGAVETAAGTPVAFNADVPAAIRTAMATVLANTAEEDPGQLVILANPADMALLQDVTPVGGQTIGERFQRFSGALVYPSTAVTAGSMTVANLRVGARYFEARGLTSVTDTDVKTGVETFASFIVAGYGVTLTSGFAVAQEVVTA